MVDANRVDPRLALGQERFHRDLGMDAAGVRARRLRVQVEPLDQQHGHALARQVIGRGGTGEPAADDQHVGAAAGLSHVPVWVCRARSGHLSFAEHGFGSPEGD